MGTERDESGITLQLYNDEGHPDGDPYFGRFTHIAGKRRDEVVRTLPLKGDEIDQPGSDDWLTLIAIADTAEKLREILHSTKVKPLTSSQSSHSSRRVLIELNVKGAKLTLKNRITVASGPILSLEPTDIRIKVAHVKALPERAELREGHPLFKEFVGGMRATLNNKR